MICDTESCKFLAEAWKIFRKHDKDQSGNLTKKELKGNANWTLHRALGLFLVFAVFAAKKRVV